MTITLCSKCNTMKNIEGFNDCARCMEKKEMTTRELLDEYAGCYRVVDNCEDDGYGCKMCLEDRERMQEIIQELEASIRKEVVEQVETFISKNEGWDSGTAWETMVVSSTELRTLLQGITLK